MKASFFRRPLRTAGLGLATAILAAGLAVSAPTASSAANPQDVREGTGLQLLRTGTAGPQQTCNYVVWWPSGINVHRYKNRESKILRHYKYGARLGPLPCGNEPGGNYGSCGKGKEWKQGYGGFLATKCLSRL
jgi:hypothetical protein